MATSTKYRVLLNGQFRDANNIDFIDHIANWSNFVPTTRRHPKYHSFTQSFSNKDLIFVKGARTYLKNLYDTRGSFASVTFKVQRFSFASEEYIDIVDGSLDFATYNDDEVAGTTTLLFQTSTVSEKLLSRVRTRTSLQTLKDFDGNALTAFTGDHGETYSLSVTKTELDNLTEIATSTASVMLVWEVALRLAQKVIGREDALRSDLLGRANGEVFQTTTDGELSYLAITNGALLRGGSTSTYPLRVSFDELFDILNNITPIGMGIEEINNEPFIRIEKVEYFYDNQNGIVWDINPPEQLRVLAVPERRYGRVLTGFRRYEKANNNGVDGAIAYEETLHGTRSFVTGLDSVTNRDYNTRINAIASSQLIEVVRNNQVTNNTSDETNNLLVLLQVSRSGSTWSIDNSYVSETGVNNPSSQKNYKITPGRTVLNHLKMINGCLNLEYKNREATEVGFTGFSPILYQEGTGDTSASVQLTGESAEIAENADLSASVEPIYYDKNLEIETTVTEDLYDTIQANLSKWVRVEYNGAIYYGYIDQMNFSSLNSLRLICKFANIDFTP